MDSIIKIESIKVYARINAAEKTKNKKYPIGKKAIITFIAWSGMEKETSFKLGIPKKIEKN